MKPSRGEAWIIEFFPAIYSITQKVPKVGAVADAARPSASCSITLNLCLVVIGIGLLTHAYNSDWLMLVALERRHSELEPSRLEILANIQQRC